MTDRIFKPDSGTDLVFEDAGSTDRLRITDGGSTVLYEDGGAAALTVEPSGDVTVETGNLVIGTAGQGIDFGATADGGVSTPSELLDDYEEGTFTPTSNTGTSSTWGHYAKVGSIVHIWARWIFNATGASATLTGLPFTSAAIGNQAGIMITNGVGWPANMTSCTGQIGASSTTFSPMMSGDNVPWDSGLSVVTGESVILQVTYRA